MKTVKNLLIITTFHRQRTGEQMRLGFLERIIEALLSRSRQCLRRQPWGNAGIARLKPDGTRAETRFLLSPKRTIPFKSAGESVQSTAGSRGVRISVSNAGYTTFRGGVRVPATHSIRQFPLHFPSRASPCATRFQKSSTRGWHWLC